MTCVPCRLFIRFISLWRTNEKPCREPSIKSPSSFLLFFSVSSISIQSKTLWFKSWLNWKRRVERFLREDKIIVQSPAEANNTVEIDQPCSSSQALYRFVIELHQQHRVILHVVWRLWSSEIQSPSTSLHNQSFHREKMFDPSPVKILSRHNCNTRLDIDFVEYSCE